MAAETDYFEEKKLENRTLVLLRVGQGAVHFFVAKNILVPDIRQSLGLIILKLKVLGPLIMQQASLQISFYFFCQNPTTSGW